MPALRSLKALLSEKVSESANCRAWGWAVSLPDKTGMLSVTKCITRKVIQRISKKKPDCFHMTRPLLRFKIFLFFWSIFPRVIMHFIQLTLKVKFINNLWHRAQTLIPSHLHNHLAEWHSKKSVLGSIKS